MSTQNEWEVLRPRFDTIEAIAAQVVDRGRWCVWILTEREGGKLGKVPHQFKSGQMSPIGCNSPTQWVDFQKARQWYGAGAKASGLGILIGGGEGASHYDSGLVAVDIDHCIVDGELADGLPVEVRLAVDAMKGAGVYLELSPSGTGLRGLWRGCKGPGIREKVVHAGIGREMYDGLTNGRYVTVTGAAWAGSLPVFPELSEEFAWDIADSLGLLVEQAGDDAGTSESVRDLPHISDADIIKKIKQAGQGKGKRLWDGDLSDYAGDHSAADMALCRLVARWTDDASQVVRVWGASALAKRDKFKRKDYKDRTVQAAIKAAREDASKAATATTSKSALITEALKAGDCNDTLAGVIAQWGGKIPATIASAEVILALDRRLTGAFAFDAFSGSAIKLRSLRECLGDVVPPDEAPALGQMWSDADTLAITVWIERVWGVSIKSGLVDDALTVAAKRRPVNLVVDRLEMLKWDGKPRLSRWLIDYMQADTDYDPPRYLEAIGRAWLIGTVARAYAPGVKHDGVLVMEGGQGLRKSLAARVLASAIAPHTFREGLPPLTHEQEAQMALRGVWICELAELAFMDRATAEHTKSFLTRMVDTFRPKFGRRDVAVPRTVSFIGSTNHSQYVQDSTGARRFWSFRVRKAIDTDALAAVAEQLFAEAVAAFKAGEAHHLTDAVVLSMALASQSVRQERSGWDELLEDRVVARLVAGGVGEASTYYASALELFKLAVPDASESEFYKSARSFNEALVRVGFVKSGTKRRSMWSVGENLMSHIVESKS